MRIGYVVKRYPRYSETFIVNEILAHERAGLDIEIFSIRPNTDTHFQDRISRVRAPVHYLSSANIRTATFWNLVREADQSLLGFWSILRTAVQEADHGIVPGWLLESFAHTGILVPFSVVVNTYRHETLLRTVDDQWMAQNLSSEFTTRASTGNLLEQQKEGLSILSRHL